MSIANKLVTIAENVNKVYESGKEAAGDEFYDKGYGEGYEAGYNNGTMPIYNLNSFYTSWQNAVFPENTDLIIKVKGITSAYNAFHSSKNLKSIKLISETPETALEAQNMFRGCEELELIDLTEFNRRFKRIDWFILADKKLKTILGALDLSVCTSVTNAFNTNTGVLEDIEFVPNTILISIDFSSCSKLTHDSLMSILYGLATVTETQVLKLGTTNLAKLTDEEKAIATEKGWTLA